MIVTTVAGGRKGTGGDGGAAPRRAWIGRTAASSMPPASCTSPTATTTGSAACSCPERGRFPRRPPPCAGSSCSRSPFSPPPSPRRTTTSSAPTRWSRTACRRGRSPQYKLEEQGLRRHRARLLGLRPGAVRRQDAGLRHGLPGRRRLRRTRRAQFRVPIVFDNLIHKKEMPVTIGIFINPGIVPRQGRQEGRRSNRSFEYDTLSDQYARFLEKEILPEVGKKYNLRKDAAGRGDRRHQLGRHLRLHRRVGAARPVQQGAQPRRQLHQHPRRRRLSRA